MLPLVLQLLAACVTKSADTITCLYSPVVMPTTCISHYLLPTTCISHYLHYTTCIPHYLLPTTCITLLAAHHLLPTTCNPHYLLPLTCCPPLAIHATCCPTLAFHTTCYPLLAIHNLLTTLLRAGDEKAAAKFISLHDCYQIVDQAAGQAPIPDSHDHDNTRTHSYTHKQSTSPHLNLQVLRSRTRGTHAYCDMETTSSTDAHLDWVAAREAAKHAGQKAGKHLYEYTIKGESTVISDAVTR